MSPVTCRNCPGIFAENCEKAQIHIKFCKNKCVFCQQTFVSADREMAWQDHVLAHQPKEVIYAHKNQILLRLPTLPRIDETLPSLWSCQSCNTTFHTKIAVKAHFIQTHGIRFNRRNYQVVCECCGKTVTDVTEHLITHQKQMYLCKAVSGCNARFENEKSLKRHEKAVHNYEENNCMKCQKTFVNVILFEKHQKNHLLNEAFSKCAVFSCNYMTNNHVDNTNHTIGSHLGTCLVCYKNFYKFSSEVNLMSVIAHERKSHKFDRNKLNTLCQFCNIENVVMPTINSKEVILFLKGSYGMHNIKLLVKRLLSNDPHDQHSSRKNAFLSKTLSDAHRNDHFISDDVIAFIKNLFTRPMTFKNEEAFENWVLVPEILIFTVAHMLQLPNIVAQYIYTFESAAITHKNEDFEMPIKN